MEYSKLARSQFSLGLALAYVAMQLPSLRSLAKYFVYPYLSIPAFLIVSLVRTFIVLRPSIQLAKVLDKAWPTVAIWAVFTIISMVLYPYADGLKHVGAGSD